MRIIPAIDIIDGQCVRLSQGDYSRKKTYSNNPLEVAKSFEDAGLEYLHVVDLDGARAKKVVNFKTLEKITSNTKLKVDFGGGLKTTDDVERVFDLGVHQITAGSIAAKDPLLVNAWAKEFGREKIILGADFRENKIAVNGWEESTELKLADFIGRYYRQGFRYVVATDISKDGMLAGPSLDQYQKLIKTFPELKLIASGGVQNAADLKKLKSIGCEGVIIGKALYEGRIKLSELC